MQYIGENQATQKQRQGNESDQSNRNTSDSVQDGRNGIGRKAKLGKIKINGALLGVFVQLKGPLVKVDDDQPFYAQ